MPTWAIKAVVFSGRCFSSRAELISLLASALDTVPTPQMESRARRLRPPSWCPPLEDAAGVDVGTQRTRPPRYTILCGQRTEPNKGSKAKLTI